MDLITLLGISGILASIYAIYVEWSAKGNAKGKKYVALCDINDNMSCSRVLTSDYARLAKMFLGLEDGSPFNWPNTYYGLLFYVAVTLYPMYPFTLIPFREYLFLGASVGSILASCVLAWILYFRLKDLCLVCATTYVINIGILYFAFYECI